VQGNAPDGQRTSDKIRFGRKKTVGAAGKEIRPESLRLDRISDVGAHVVEPAIEDQRYRAVEIERTARFDAQSDAALSRQRDRFAYVGDEMKAIVLHPAIRAADARVTAFDNELLSSISPDSAFAYFGDVERLAAQTCDRIAPNPRERSEQHVR
jgi:hypothetical protein